MFSYDTALKSAGALFKWKLVKCRNASEMFANSGLETTRGLGQLSIGRDLQSASVYRMFAGSKLKDLESFGKFLNDSSISSTSGMCSGCEDLEDISSLSEWAGHILQLRSTKGMFSSCIKVKDISSVFTWTGMSNVTDISQMFLGVRVENVNGLNSWILNSNAKITQLLGSAIFNINDEYIGPSIIDASGIQWAGLSFTNVFGEYSATKRPGTVQHYNKHIPGYENVTTFQTSVGPFAGLDSYYNEGTIQLDTVNRIAYGTITMYFCFASRLPSWYKQMWVNGWADYFRLYYTNSGYTYTGQVLLGN